RQFGQQSCSLFETVLLARFDLLGDCLLALGQLGHYTPSTFRPMLRAEPAMVRTAASSSAAVRSACLVLAISSSWARVTVPAFCGSGRAEPLLTPAAFFSSTAAGLLLVSKVKPRSLYTVMITGVGRPGSWPWVLALNALQNSMIFTPC